jgi:hypothetical protein
MAQLQLLGHELVTEQVIRDDHRDAMLLHQRLQPTPHCLRVVFIHIPDRQRFSRPQVNRYQHRLFASPAQDISPIQAQYPHWLPLAPSFAPLCLGLHVPPDAHMAQRHLQSTQDQAAGAMAQTQPPQDGCKDL